MEATPAKASRRWNLFLAAAYLVICLVLFSRRADWLLNRQLWAEDGLVWLNLGLAHGFKAVFWPHSGYCQLWPKLVAAFFDPFNIYYAPLVLGLSALAVMGFTYWLILTDFAGGFMPRKWRLIAAAALCLTPWYAETYHNLTGGQYYLFPAAALIVMGDLNRLNRWAKIGLLLFMFLVCFSAANAVLLAPILAYRAWRRRGRRDYVFWFSGLSLAMLGANIIVSRSVYDTAGGLASDFFFDPEYLLPYLVKTFGFKTAALSLYGQTYSFRAVTHPDGWWALSVGCALLAGVYVLVALRRTPSAPVRLGLLYFIAVPLLFSYFARKWNVEYFVLHDGLIGGTRYFVYTSMFFIIWLTDACRMLWSEIKPNKLVPKIAARAFPVALALIFAWAAWNNYTYPATPDLGWKRQIVSYYKKLLKQNKKVALRYAVAIAPSREWYLPLPVFLPSPEERARIQRILDHLSR